MDSCSLDIVFEESEWWPSFIIERFEIFKMAYRMAAIRYHKDSLTSIGG